MNRSQYKHALLTHDWGFADSDDYRCLREGTRQGLELKYTYDVLRPPFTSAALRAWSQGLIRTKMRREGKKWAHQGLLLSDAETVSQHMVEEIEAWFQG